MLQDSSQDQVYETLLFSFKKSQPTNLHLVTGILPRGGRSNKKPLLVGRFNPIENYE